MLEWAVPLRPVVGSGETVRIRPVVWCNTFMKLLTSVFLRNGRVLPAGGWFTLACVAFLAGLEIAGRFATSDLHDGLAAFMLIGAGLLVAVRHRREPLPWIVRLAAVGRRLVTSASERLGRQR